MQAVPWGSKARVGTPCPLSSTGFLAKVPGNLQSQPKSLKANLYLPFLSKYCHRICFPSLACLQRTNIFPRVVSSLAKPAESCYVSVLSLRYRARFCQSYLHEIKLYCTVGSFNVNGTDTGRNNKSIGLPQSPEVNRNFIFTSLHFGLNPAAVVMGGSGFDSLYNEILTDTEFIWVKLSLEENR